MLRRSPSLLGDLSKNLYRFFMGVCLLALASLTVSPAMADGIPHLWGIDLQAAATGTAARIGSFHNLLLIIITVVTVVVMGLLIYVMLRFNKRANPTPQKFIHNLKLEIIWTAIPCIIILGIAVISFPLLYYIDRMPPPDLTLKVTGHQWYWSYEYPDQGEISFDSLGIWSGPEITPEQASASIKDASSHWLIKSEPRRLLEVDNRVVLPVGKVVRVQITGADVLHSWFVPAVGINRMAVVGRLNEVWFKLDHEGIFYGQCSMICGNGHGYMPIVIEGVSPAAFDAWVASKKANG